MDDLLKKRSDAIAQPGRRQNFITKHCNIVYQGVGTDTYIPLAELRKCRALNIDWSGRCVWVGVDLALSTDNCAVAMLAEEDGVVFAHVMAFVPEGRVVEKSETEKLDYRAFIDAGECIACGDLTVDYPVIEDYVLSLEDRYGVKIVGVGYDRWNALSSAQKWERAGYSVTEIGQHSRFLHPPTKLLEELVLNGKFQYEENRLLEVNFQNAKCDYDTNLNRYLTKKKSAGKVDMVAATIDAMYLLQQDVIFSRPMDWAIQIL